MILNHFVGVWFERIHEPIDLVVGLVCVTCPWTVWTTRIISVQKMSTVTCAFMSVFVVLDSSVRSNDVPRTRCVLEMLNEERANKAPLLDSNLCVSLGFCRARYL